MIEYTAAAVHFEAAKHSRYQACVENNLAMLYLRLNRFAEAHEHLDRAQALFTRLNDRVHLAQVEETRARVMLAEGHIVKAESVIRAAVRMLRPTGDASLLADALTTHGVILARLGKMTDARAALHEAIALAETAGDNETAGVACLTLLENSMQDLSDDDLCDALDRAKWLLSLSKDVSLKDRLVECAFRALVLFRAVKPDWTNFSLQDTVHHQEARFIRMALEESNGVLSQAARLLGLSGHQSLGYILTGRHKALGDELARRDQPPGS